MARALAETAPENRSRVMIIAAVAFAAIAAVLLFVALQNANDGGGSSAAADTEVVVASQDISVNTTLTSDMLEIKSVPADQALAGVYGSIDSAVGLPARIPIQQGEQLTTAKVGITQIEEEKDLALTLDKGMRGFSIPASEVDAVGGLLLADNHVDIIAVFEDNDGNLLRAVTVLQNIKVLSVAQEALEPVPAAPTPAEGETADNVQSQRPEDIERQPGANSLTLAVTPDQVQFLALLMDREGVRLRAALRAVDDNDTPAINEITQQVNQ